MSGRSSKAEEEVAASGAAVFDLEVLLEAA
jgi:hypothetical protein